MYDFNDKFRNDYQFNDQFSLIKEVDIYSEESDPYNTSELPIIDKNHQENYNTNININSFSQIHVSTFFLINYIFFAFY